MYTGSRVIAYHKRQYCTLYDPPRKSEPQPKYPAQGTEVDHINKFRQDTTPNPIKAQVLVEERQSTSYFYYRAKFSYGRVLVAPSIFFESLKMTLA
jgi:hypothetical protein